MTIFIWLTSSVVATIAGPFGTSVTMDIPLRAVYWVVVVSCAVVIGYIVRALVLALVGADRPGLLDGAMIALMSLVFGPFVWVVTGVIRGVPTSQVPPLMAFVGYVMLVTAVIIVGRRFVPGFETQNYDFLADAGQKPRPKPAALPRLLRRLPESVRGDVLRLSARDHFVEVVTNKGTEALRMRLVDAIDEMEPVHGYCIHRSHWVTHEAIDRIERENSHKTFVVLSNGDRLPASRKYRVNLEKVGLL